MRKSDLFQISDLMDQKFDEKLKNLATKDDLKQFATKEDLQQFATKDDLKQFATKDDFNGIREDLKKFATKEELTIEIDRAINTLALIINEGFDEDVKEHVEICTKLEKINSGLLDRPTRDEIFEKWDNNIDQIRCDVDGLKFIHRDEWKQLPDRATIKSALDTRSI